MSSKDTWCGREPVPDDVADRLGDVGDVLAKHHVRLGYVFGSAVEGRRGSDVDLALLGRTGAVREARGDLVQALGTERLHVVDLNASTHFLQREVVTTGEVLHAEEGETQRRYETAVLREAPERLTDTETPNLSPDAARRWVYRRWNALNKQVETLWQHRACSAADLRASANLRWEVERGLLSALTLVANMLEQIRHLAEEDNDTEGPRLFSRRLCAQLDGLRTTRLRLTSPGQPVSFAELARRTRHALHWLPLFLRETHDWLALREDPGTQ